MTIDNLVATCMKRFGLENNNPQDYYVSLALPESRILPDRKELVSAVFSKYTSMIDNGTGRVYLSRKVLPSRVDSKSVTSASIASQRKLSHRVSLLGSAIGKKPDEMNLEEFNASLDTIYDSEFIGKLESATNNIITHQSLYTELESQLEKSPLSAGKLRTNEQYEAAQSQENDLLADDVKEDLELVKALQKNLEAILLISLKMCAD